jgi:starch synthase
MDILMACSEFAPIIGGGAAGDAVEALAKTLSRLEHNVTIALPRYPEIEKSGIMLARRLMALRVDVGGERVDAMLFDARLSSGLELVVIDVPGLFDAPGVYGEHAVDDLQTAKRFGLYCRALAQLVHKRAEKGTGFDVVHAHDWQMALLPYLLRDNDVRTVLTVHDASAQGRYPREAVDLIGLDAADFNPAALEFYGQLNMLKAGIVSADVVTTVSPHYADELRTPEGGHGLDGVFAARADSFAGIANGIDYGHWSPSTDPHIVARYDAEDVANKGRCKASLLRELDLPLEPDRPLIVALGEVSEQNGSDVLAAALGDITRTDARVVVAGTGEAALEAALENATSSLPGDAVYLGAVSDPMTHRLIGAADALIVAPRGEPCGQAHLRAQRYGALPIVHGVGGLCDTVVDCDAQAETGTGFVFDELTPEALAAAVGSAVGIMRTPRWGTLRRRVMRLDVSWERPARRYARLYNTPSS